MTHGQIDNLLLIYVFQNIQTSVNIFLIYTADFKNI